MAPIGDGNFYRDLNKEYPVIERVEGIHVQDAQGRKYIDFGSGIGVTSIGGGVGDVLERIREQRHKCTFVVNGYFTNEPRRQMANKLLAQCPANMGGVIFVSSGSEANEVAIKIARQYHVETGNPSKFQVISRGKSYHGNTLSTLSVSDRESWSHHCQPYLHEFAKISAPYCYRCPLKLTYPSCELRCAHELDDVIAAAVPRRCPRSSPILSSVRRSRALPRRGRTTTSFGRSATVTRFCSSPMKSSPGSAGPV